LIIDANAVYAVNVDCLDAIGGGPMFLPAEYAWTEPVAITAIGVFIIS
jgi:hypothetical protein